MSNLVECETCGRNTLQVHETRLPRTDPDDTQTWKVCPLCYEYEHGRKLDEVSPVSLSDSQVQSLRDIWPVDRRDFQRVCDVLLEDRRVMSLLRQEITELRTDLLHAIERRDWLTDQLYPGLPEDLDPT